MATEEDRRIYINRVLTREKIVKATDVGSLDINFYDLMRAEMATMPEKDQELFLRNMNTFVNNRLVKMLRLAAIHPASNEILGKLAVEEQMLYRVVREHVEKFKTAIYTQEEKEQPQPPVEDAKADLPDAKSAGSESETTSSV